MTKIKRSRIAIFTIFSGLLVAPTHANVTVNQTQYNAWEYLEEIDQSIWRQGRLDSIKNIQSGLNNNWSPKGWSQLNNEEKYGGPTRYIAHRGLVDLYNGIAENSVHAVLNAAKHNQFMVEIDVQVTKDNVIVPIHDNSLHRVLNRDALINTVPFSEIKNKSMLIKNPNGTYSRSNQGQCAAGNKIYSLDEMISNIAHKDDRTFVRDFGFIGCDSYNLGEITWVLDPKNLKAAQQIIVQLNNRSSKLYRHRNSIVMKVYPSFYWNDDGTETKNPVEIANVAGKVANKLNTRSIKVIPVVSIGNFLQDNEVNKAISLSLEVAKDWGRYFEVLSIETPGAWNLNWPQFAENLEDQLEYAAYRTPTKNNNFPNNPLKWSTKYPSPEFQYYSPRISVGYRFADYVQDGTYPYYQDGKAMNWNMEGRASEDRTTKARRTIGGISKTTKPYCDTEKACWITTDYPLHEWGFRYGLLGNGVDESVHNAPMTNLDNR